MATNDFALWRINTDINAQRDERQDNRAWTTSQANSYTYAPIFAFDSSVMGNTARSNASAEASAQFSDEQGFTGKNAQTTMIALGAVGILTIAGIVLLEK